MAGRRLLQSLLVLVASLALVASSSSSIPLIDDKIIFVPPANYTDPRVLYARTAELKHSNNALLATWENYSDEPPLVYFPIYKSTDHGQSWKHISDVRDQVNGWGLRYRMFLGLLNSFFLRVDTDGPKQSLSCMNSQSTLQASEPARCCWRATRSQQT